MTGTLSVKVNHFSTYAVYKTSAQPADNGNNDVNPHSSATGIFVSLGAAAAAALLL